MNILGLEYLPLPIRVRRVPYDNPTIHDRPPKSFPQSSIAVFGFEGFVFDGLLDIFVHVC